jgi:hypothetical protein
MEGTTCLPPESGPPDPGVARLPTPPGCPPVGISQPGRAGWRAHEEGPAWDDAVPVKAAAVLDQLGGFQAILGARTTVNVG